MAGPVGASLASQAKRLILGRLKSSPMGAKLASRNGTLEPADRAAIGQRTSLVEGQRMPVRVTLAGCVPVCFDFGAAGAGVWKGGGMEEPSVVHCALSAGRASGQRTAHAPYRAPSASRVARAPEYIQYGGMQQATRKLQKWRYVDIAATSCNLQCATCNAQPAARNSTQQHATIRQDSTTLRGGMRTGVVCQY